MPGGLDQRVTRYALVDLGRVLAAHHQESARGEERAAFLQEVKLVVAKLAAAQDWQLVLDSSAISAGEIPFVPATNGAHDLTEEVLRALEPRRLSADGRTAP
jgi:hypothetical protein